MTAHRKIGGSIPPRDVSFFVFLGFIRIIIYEKFLCANFKQLVRVYIAVSTLINLSVSSTPNLPLIREAQVDTKRRRNISLLLPTGLEIICIFLEKRDIFSVQFNQLPVCRDAI